MGSLSDDRLNRLLHEAYPAVEVSPDFTLRLWRRMMKQPFPPYWKVPAPALALAACIGILAGVWTQFGAQPAGDVPVSVLARSERWDLFGTAPNDTVTGSVLRLMKGERA